MIGYSLSTVKRNKAASIKNIGVRLGRIAIKKDVPVDEIANHLGVSTVSVYAWFYGTYNPKPNIVDKLTKFLSKK